MRRAAGASPADARTGGVSEGPSPARRRWARSTRVARWLVAGAVVPVLWACSSHRLSIPDSQPTTVDQRMFRQTVNHKLDLLFMVDDSPSMEPLQKKMSDQLGTFMDTLVDPSTGQLPDMHVAVVSSSFGAGRWGNIKQCENEVHPGDDGGKFVQGPGGPGHGTCAMLHPDARFLDTGDGNQTPQNFEGDIREAFKCIALLGDTGCGFESQFKSVMYALSKAAVASDPDNGGFLRPEAVLAVVMVTNEDDCSVSDQSLLLYPGVNTVADSVGLGAAQNYRCNEFGHVCDGKAPPHGYPDVIPASGIELHNCVSAEDDGPKNDDLLTVENGEHDPTHGHLWPTVKDFTAFIKSLKPEDRQRDILVAAIAGPPTSYRVIPVKNPSNGEMDPQVDHSCTLDTGDPAKQEFADPAVRINQWREAFGTAGLFYPICAKTLGPAMTTIAQRIHETIGSSCVATDLAWRNPSDHGEGHNCQAERKSGTAGGSASKQLDECTPIVTRADAPEAPTNAPCYQLLPNAEACAKAETRTLFRVCENADCKPPSTSTERLDASISCALP